MLYGFCFFSTPGTLSGLLEARAGTPHPRTDPARLPRDAQQRPQHPYSTGDSNMLDNVNINVNINVNAPDGAGPSPEQPAKHSPTHVPPRPDMPARCRSRVVHRGAHREPARCVQLCSPRGPLRRLQALRRPLARMGKAGKKVTSPIKRAAQMVHRRRPDSTAAPRTALIRAVCLPLQVHNAGGTMSAVRPRLRLRARW